MEDKINDLRIKPTMDEFTGIDLSSVETIYCSENKNGDPIYGYKLNDIAELLDVKKKNIKHLLNNEIDYFELNTDRGIVTYLTEYGVMKVFQDLEVEITQEFKDKMNKVNVDYYNYGVVADKHVKGLFDQLITETEILDPQDNSPYMESIYELIYSTVWQIED